MRLSIRAMKRYGHGTLRLVTTGHSRSQNGVQRTPCRWSMLTCRRQTLGGKRLICFTAAWMPGAFKLKTALRAFCPGMTKERTKEKISEAKRRQTQGFFCRALRTRPRLEIARRTSIGVPPRFSPQGVFHRKGLSLGPCFLGPGERRFAPFFERHYPPLPVPV